RLHLEDAPRVRPKLLGRDAIGDHDEPRQCQPSSSTERSTTRKVSLAHVGRFRESIASGKDDGMIAKAPPACLSGGGGETSRLRGFFGSVQNAPHHGPKRFGPLDAK